MSQCEVTSDVMTIFFDKKRAKIAKKSGSVFRGY